jgi:hypothetical protein
MLTFICGMWTGAGIVLAFWAGAIVQERGISRGR